MEFSVLLKITGGLGLFLLGMVIMTEGLRALAGDAMRGILLRFTKNPVTGAITGSIATVILQSSSATTVTAVGFVGAGLMSFSQALGVIFGANIGTTLRGWVIVLVGFKLQLGLILMPFALFGALAKLVSRKRLAQIGYAMAGFSLIFIGIDVLQQAMQGLGSVITPADFPEDTWPGRFKLLLTGAIITVVMQSSGAGVAATLTALYANTINFEQAAALVIGMDIGTTITAAMATIGGTVGARRTGFSHVIYNLLTGLGALLLLSPYIHIMEWINPGVLQQNAEFALVTFHSGFNILGVLVVLPFTHQFAHFIERIFPERAPVYTHGLDNSLFKEPGIALTAIHSAILDEVQALLAHVRELLSDTAIDNKINLEELQAALSKTQEFLDQIHLKNGESPHWNELLAEIHSLDHMQRLHERCKEDAHRAETARITPELSQAVHNFKNALNEISYELASRQFSQAHSLAQQIKHYMEAQAEPLRTDIMHRVADGKFNIREGTERLEAIRWLVRVCVHIERITHHLQTEK